MGGGFQGLGFRAKASVRDFKGFMTSTVFVWGFEFRRGSRRVLNLEGLKGVLEEFLKALQGFYKRFKQAKWRNCKSTTRAKFCLSVAHLGSKQIHGNSPVFP